MRHTSNRGRKTPNKIKLSFIIDNKDGSFSISELSNLVLCDFKGAKRFIHK